MRPTPQARGSAAPAPAGAHPAPRSSARRRHPLPQRDTGAHPRTPSWA